MRKEILVLFIFAGSIWAISAHGQEPCAARSKILLSRERPSIYLSYERLSTRPHKPLRLAEGVPPAGNSESTESQIPPNVVLLRLHNNTSWAILFPTESLYVGPAVTRWRLCDGTGVLGLQDGMEVNGRYELDLLDIGKTSSSNRSTGVSELRRTDVFSNSWLPAGRSVIIPIFKEHLKKDLAIYLPVNYEWETVKSVVRGDEAQHRVYYYFWNLPENVRQE